MDHVYIVTYHFSGHSQIEGVFANFEDSENFANTLRDEALKYGSLSDYVTNYKTEIIK